MGCEERWDRWVEQEGAGMCLVTTKMHEDVSLSLHPKNVGKAFTMRLERPVTWSCEFFPSALWWMRGKTERGAPALVNKASVHRQ